MPTGVTHRFGGTVVVVDLPSQRRFDLTPEQAEEGALKVEAAAAGGTASLVVLEAMHDREFRFAGDPGDAARMAADLREHAALAQGILDNPNEVA